MCLVGPSGIRFSPPSSADLVSQIDAAAGGPGSVPATDTATPDTEETTSSNSFPIVFGAAAVVIMAGMGLFVRSRRSQDEPEIEGFRLNRSE